MAVQKKSLEDLPPSEIQSIGGGDVTWDEGAEIRARTKYVHDRADNGKPSVS